MIIKRLRTFPAISYVVTCGSLILTLGCGCGIPFPSNDPPPTFAVSYTIQSQSPSYPVIPYTQGTWMNGVFSGVTIAGTPFVPSGSTVPFQEQVDSCGYFIAENSYWPALWYITPESGPCAGSRAAGYISSKITSSVCKVGIVTPIEVVPSSYVGNAPPAYITISVSSSVVAPGTGITSYIVDDSGTIWSQVSTNLGANGSADVAAPALPPATYYVVAQYDVLASDGSPAGSNNLVATPPSRNGCTQSPCTEIAGN